jgi:hypothetical protein
MDPQIMVLGLGADPRIFKGVSDNDRRKSATEEQPILTYKGQGSGDFDPFGFFDLLDLLDFASSFF